MTSFLTSNEHFLKRARNIRNELLIKTDRYMLEDYPNLTKEEFTEIKKYRHELRKIYKYKQRKYINKWTNPRFSNKTGFYKYKYNILINNIKILIYQLY